MLAPLAIAARIVANPLANLFQKQLAHARADPLFVVGVTHALLSVPAAGLLAAAPVFPSSPDFAIAILAAAILAVAGNTLLVYALEAGDLSVLGPLNAFKPLLSVLLALVLVGEVPTLPGLAGMALIVAGSYGIIERDPAAPRGRAALRFLSGPAVRLRFAALALSATEAVCLKKAILLSSPLFAFALWCLLGFVVAGAAIVLGYRARVPAQARLFREYPGTYLRLAAATGVMQCATLFAFGALQVGYALALFQLSALGSVLLGHHYFREPDIARRLTGAALMVAGAALIVARGQP